MANIYVSSASWASVTAWAALTAASSTANGGRGTYVRQSATPTVGNERVFRCTTSGTTGATEPSWTLTKNGTTSDGTATWTECTGQEADQVSGTWKAPHARLANAFASTWGAAGDVFQVGDDHAETQSTAMTLTSPGTAASPCIIQCVRVASGTVPPVSADIKTTPTATITTTGSGTITIGGAGAVSDWWGIALSSGSGAVTAQLSLASAGSGNFVSMHNCLLAKLGTASSVSAISFGAISATSACGVALYNTTLKFGNVSDRMSIKGRLLWRNTPSAIQGATLPTTLVSLDSPAPVLFDGVDLSALGSGKTIFGSASGPGAPVIKDCILGSGVTVMATPTLRGAAEAFVVRADSAGTNYRNEKYGYDGTLTTETTIVRTGGASDGRTAQSWNVTTTANSKWSFPFEALPIVVDNPTSGASVTVTIYGVWNAAALPNNDDVWADVSYLGSASSPQASFVTGTKADFLATGSALTASTQAWDSLVTARANSTAYSVGDVRKVASNSGRIFFCTTAGTSASSEPAGYASASDGGSVTDGTATFRAATRFQQTITLSSPQPAQKGYLYVTPKVAKASASLYLCPKVLLS